MAEKGVAKRFLETKWFGLVIGLGVFGLMAALTWGTNIISNIETKVLDFNFRMKNPKVSTRIQEGVTVEETNPRISPDILIVGIDERALARFGRWPFPRYRHADFVNTFARIADQGQRERALFLDIFFNEPDDKSPQDDAAVVDAIAANGRVFLETVLQREEFPESPGMGPFEREAILAKNYGAIEHLTGDWKQVDSFLGLKPPLLPYTLVTRGYGHANFVQDEDQVFRRAALVTRASRLVEEIPLDQLSLETQVDTAGYERLSWRDIHNVEHDIPVPFTAEVIEETWEAMRRQAPPATVERIALVDLTIELAQTFGSRDHVYWLDNRGKVRDIAIPVTTESLAKVRAQVEREAAAVVRAGQKEYARVARKLARREKKRGEPAPAQDPAPVVTATELADGWSVNRESFVVRRFHETILPAITLSLAAEYVNVKLSDVEVALGEYIRFPHPQQWNGDTASWEPYTVLVRPAKVDRDTSEVLRSEQRTTVDEIRIPIDEGGRMMVNFMGYPSSSSIGAASTYTVRSYSRYAAAPPVSDPATWDETLNMANKIVMVGAFSQGMAEDQKPTPFGLMFGVEIHANALNTILMANFLRYAPEWLSLLIIFGMVMLTAFMTGRLSTVWSLVVVVVSLVVYFGVVLVLFDFQAYILMLSAPLLGAFLSFLGVVAYRTVFEERDKRKNKAIFSKIVGPAVLDQILADPPELGGKDKELTVFFSDIRSFSSISEKMNSQDLLNYLNSYLSTMADTVKEYNGTLDKYIGDAVMCFWGAPIDQADHALLACKCALKQMEALAILNEGYRAKKQDPIDIGIGISTGIMTAGFMGSSDRLNYTVIGDSVNLGSRLEGMNKMYYDTAKGAGRFSRIIISENTYEQVKDKVIARELDVVRVKGKQEPAVIYELLDIEGGYEPPKPPASKGKMLAEEAKNDMRARADKAKAEARGRKT